jgi:CysZ protein
MVKSFWIGADCAFRGLGTLGRPGIRRFVAIPLLINVLVFGGGLWWASTSLASLVDAWVERAVSWLPGWLNWLALTVEWLLWAVLGVGALIVIFYSFTILANLIAAPYNGLLAEQVERRLYDNLPNSGSPLWKELVRAPAQELKKLFYFLIRAVPLLLLFLIPGINILAPFIWAAFTSWMLALQYLDYPLGNHGLAFAEQRKVLRMERPMMLGFGAVVLFFTMIPVLNFFAMPTAVVGATLLAAERLDV